MRLVVLINDVSYRNLIPAELGKGFGFVHGNERTLPVAVTPDELGGAWSDERARANSISGWCVTCGALVRQSKCADDMTFSLYDLISHAAKTRPLRAGTLIGSGTISNHDKTTGYACIMEKRLVEQVELGEAKGFPALRRWVEIDMFDHHGETILGRSGSGWRRQNNGRPNRSRPAWRLHKHPTRLHGRSGLLALHGGRTGLVEAPIRASPRRCRATRATNLSMCWAR